MRGWIQFDERGRSVLCRAGRGIVTAIVPLVDEPADVLARARVEIEVERPAGRPRSIRLSTAGLVFVDDPAFEAASLAELEGAPVSWSIEWHRHEWIPDAVDISSLNLVSDAEARLVALDRVGIVEEAAAFLAAETQEP